MGDKPGMARALALVHQHTAHLPLHDLVRTLIVAGCGLALVLAGPALPHF